MDEQMRLIICQSSFRTIDNRVSGEIALQVFEKWQITYWFAEISLLHVSIDDQLQDLSVMKEILEIEPFIGDVKNGIIGILIVAR